MKPKPMKPKIKPERLWVIVGPWGWRLKLTIRLIYAQEKRIHYIHGINKWSTSRKGAISGFVKFHDSFFQYHKIKYPWKWLYRRGFRCVQVEVRVIKNGKN